MHSVQFTVQSSSDGIVERDFAVGDIPGVLWSPQAGSRRAPLVLMGHGGGTHKKWPGMVGRAHRLVTAGGFHVAVIDAPGHGERPRTPTDERDVAVPRSGAETRTRKGRTGSGHLG
ncbi:alpha/beta hydrolase family protein [Streptomyces misionensis]|uniref:alpha/beta hydrolase family protein n=1 Tax=Streptomyces misionensis TaxID=67331 RepID=UPI0036A58F10